MPGKKKSPTVIQNLQKQDNTGYITYGSDVRSRSTALAKYGDTVDAFNLVNASPNINLTNVVDNVDVRRQFTRKNYEYFRPSEALPVKFNDILSAVRGIYKKISVIRHVIDLYCDFAVEDMKIVHPNAEQQAFYQLWQKKVNLPEVVNEFTRHLLIDYNVVVKRTTAKLSTAAEQQIKDNQTFARPDVKINKSVPDVSPREIPWKYTFLNIQNIHHLNAVGTLFAGDPSLTMEIPRQLISLIKDPKNEREREIVKKLPNDFVANVKAGRTNTIPLDMDKIYMATNKKDSWEVWSTPFLYAVLSDVMFKEKLRQAEISALDGVINVIRLWKLGDHKEKILPNQDVVDRLINILQSNTGGGAMDIVWDSMIEMQDFYPPIGDILGSEKYDEVNRDILIGLGIPEVLVGGKGSNFSNSFIQLKTVLQRMKYLRQQIQTWLNHELALLNVGMGYKTLPKIFFKNNNLDDENVEKRLIVGLLDRGIISPEGVLEVYGKDFEIEVNRIENQKKEFADKKIDIKGPFQNPADNVGQAANPGGRPSQTKDVTRDTKKVKPKSFIAYNTKAHEIIDYFDNSIVPEYMVLNKVKNARQLTAAHKKEIDTLRISLLSCIKYTEDINDHVISQHLEKMDIDHDLLKYIKNHVGQAKNNISIKERKLIEAAAWASFGAKNAKV